MDFILDTLIAFAMRVKAHKFFQSSRMENVSCMEVDFGNKIVKRDHIYDLAKLQL